MCPEWDEPITTTIRVSEKLWKEVKMEAIKHDMTASEIVEEGIRLWLKENKTETEEKK